MEPMTPLDQLKGIQAQIADLDLDEPMAVEMAIQLGSNFETVAGRIRKEADDARFDMIWANPMAGVLQQEDDLMAAVLACVKARGEFKADTNTPAEDAARDLQRRAK